MKILIVFLNHKYFEQVIVTSRLTPNESSLPSRLLLCIRVFADPMFLKVIHLQTHQKVDKRIWILHAFRELFKKGILRQLGILMHHIPGGVVQNSAGVPIELHCGHETPFRGNL